MPISPEERLMVTLRFLASGDSQQSHSFSFRIGRATVSKILGATCEALWVALNKEYLNLPSTTEDWVRISKEFEDSWNVPHCIGAIDGKHIMIECPKKAGSSHYNYKGYHSTVLLAICDAQYCFTFVDFDNHGSKNSMTDVFG